MSTISVSIIIPTYNRARTIIAAIQSVLDQTYNDFEIIICDDGSIDNTEAEIKKIEDTRLRYLKITHTGLPSVTRNAGIKVAKGEWIAFLDSDDTWVPNKLDHQLSFMNMKKLIASGTNAIRIVGNKKEKMHARLPVYADYSVLARTNYIITSSCMVSKKVFDCIGMFPEDEKFRAYEDWVLWMRISTAYNFGLLNEALVNYNDDFANSVRVYQLPWESMHNSLREDILYWWPKKIIKHPDSAKLFRALITVVKYKIVKFINKDTNDK